MTGRIHRHTLLKWPALAAVAGCTLFTGPKSQPTTVSISVTPDTIVAGERPAGDVTWLQFTVPISVHNPTSAALTFDLCLVSILQENGGAAWEPICAAEASNLPTIAPGATNTFQVPVTAAISGLATPKWESQTVDGSYRVRLGLGAEAEFVSNEFAISVLTVAAQTHR